MNHYEKQLYSVFKTFDVDNEEALDRSAVSDLCDSLQLEDRGAALVDTLFERRSDRVTFTQFRNGLLSVLGSEPAPSAAPPAPPHSDDDSSGREVAPKFVFGSKKYGRRSRPQRTASDESPRHRVASDSRLDGERARQRMRCKRSASAMEHRNGGFLSDEEEPAELDHDRRVDRERALALCRALRMHAVDRHTIERVFDECSVDEITVGEFFDRLDASLTSTIAASADGHASVDGVVGQAGDVLASDVVAEAWERAGVQRPRRLLLELGFPTASLLPAELERALDDELRALAAGASEDEPPDVRAYLPLAALGVARLRAEGARRRLEAAEGERDKLRADLAEANRRAQLLAQDVDENHARMEAELRARLRRLEARHAEAARTSAVEAAAERDRAGAASARLEAELARRADAEGRLRAELTSLRDQYEELQTRCCSLEESARAAEREAARLAAERRVASDAVSGAVSGAESGAVSGEVELEARAEALRGENQRLRDRCDELCAALEAVGRGGRGGPAPARGRGERGRVEESSLPTIEPEASGQNEAIKRLQGILESIPRRPPAEYASCESCGALARILATVQETIRGLDDPSCEPNPPDPSDQASPRAPPGEPGPPDPSGEMDPQEAPDEAAQTDSARALRKELAEARQAHHEDKGNLTNIIRELESSLEQMKVEYDRCEEYWARKLEEERAEHAGELRAGDERLGELAALVSAYERQFRPAPPAALPAVDERRALEHQINDLQDEFVAYRRQRDAELVAAHEQLAELRERLAAAARPAPTPAPTPAPPTSPPAAPASPRAPLMLHCAELEGQLRRQAYEAAASEAGVAGAAGATGARCACGSLAARWRQALGAREAAALRARCARAERAAQRLHARLAAADLLVKDLYVENCRLALPALPALPAGLP